MINSYLLRTQAWDPYPYILLNLFLSMLAGLQGAILLIAAKRQDAIASVMAQHDYETDVRAEAHIEMFMAINSEQLEILREGTTGYARKPHVRRGYSLQARSTRQLDVRRRRQK